MTDTPSRTPVAIVGGGPVGLALALGLARHGVQSTLLERRPATNQQSRAPAIHQRSLEILRQWAVADTLLAAGTLKRTLPMHPGPTSQRPLLTFDFTTLDHDADPAGLLFLEQGQTERLLLAALRDTGRCDIHFGTEAVALDAGADEVRLTLHDAAGRRTLAADYVVGCDGTTSFVRDALGLPFPGYDFPLRPLLADVRVADHRDQLPWPRFHNGRRGVTGAQRLAPGHWRIIRVEPGDPAPADPVPDHELDARVREVLGDGPVEVLWASRFRFQRRSSPRFRAGRVLLAGDAAHAFPPANGQGMNSGIQDAHNLAWKLRYALTGGDADRLLDSYDVERRAMVGSVSRNVSRLTRLGLQAPRAVRGAVFQLMRLGLAIPAGHRARVRNLAMIDQRVPASPLVTATDRATGQRLPNPLLIAPNGDRVRLYDLLGVGPALLRLTPTADSAPPVDPATAEPAPTAPGLRQLLIGPAGHRDPSGTLGRLLGADAGWLLVRPDLHLAWARTDSSDLAGRIEHALGLTTATGRRRGRR